MQSSSVSSGQVHFTLPPADCWSYRIEGGQKIVFSSVHSGYPAEILAVFPETDHSLTSPPSIKKQALISRYLSRYLIPAIPVRLTPDYIRRLTVIANPHRPPHRTSQLNSECLYATIHPDVALHFGSSTVLVEVKPKCAVLSRSKLIPPLQATTLGKYTTPPYHIKNYLLRDGCIPKVPYNASDLLSMDISRVKRAIDALRREQSSSLRVFKGGNVAEAENHTVALSAAAHALVASRQCCVALLTLQSYDIIDNSGAELLLTRLNRLAGEQKAHSLIREHLYHDSSCGECGAKLCYKTPKEAAVEHCEASYSEALRAAEELDSRQCACLLAWFLQAATAKDCSLLIALCPSSEAHGEGNQLAMDEGEWLFRIWAIDVGEKAISKILGKWALEDRRRTQVLASRNSIN